jgi:hypothetical protein
MSPNDVRHFMTTTPESLSSEIARITSDLKHLDLRLAAEPSPDLTVLTDFRHAVDNVRLKAWSVAELVNARYTKEDPNAVLSFLAAERVRRLDQLVRNLCGDIERGATTARTTGMHSLIDALKSLQQQLAQFSNQDARQSYKMTNAAS